MNKITKSLSEMVETQNRATNLGWVRTSGAKAEAWSEWSKGSVGRGGAKWRRRRKGGGGRGGREEAPRAPLRLTTESTTA